MSNERKFLHDISSPLTGLSFSLSTLEGLLKSGSPEDLAKARNLMAKNFKAIAAMETMIRDRREKLQADE